MAIDFEAPIRHHPVFSFQKWRGTAPAGITVDCLGTITEDRVWEVDSRGFDVETEVDYPPFDCEYFEWIDLLESIQSATDQFVMIELGAGFGRWSARAVTASRKLRQLEAFVVAVEAEPNHTEYMRCHFLINGLSKQQYVILEGAVSASGKTVDFFVGHSRDWYGQFIAWAPDAKMEAFPEAETRKVPGLKLSEVLQNAGSVDFIDMDVQGVEHEIICEAALQIDRNVKRIHIATHGEIQEQICREIFHKLGWKEGWNYPCGGTVSTPYGTMSFQDGVLGFSNPRFDR